MSFATVTRRSKPTYIAGCEECGARWYSMNAVGVAARHAQAHGHRTFVEVAYSMSFEPS